MKGERIRRLLILDDEPEVAKIVAAAARRHGFVVEWAHSSPEFFDRVPQFQPSHIIIDLLMPGMDGVEVMRDLAATGCKANIIVMSGLGAKVLESAQRAGIERGLRVSGILPKPFKLLELRALLDTEARERQAPERDVGTERDVTAQQVQAALGRGQFTLQFQPKVHLDTGRPVGVEALVRWRHPDRGLLMPDRFLGLVEETGNMQRLTDLMIDQGLRWLAGAGIHASTELAINVSGACLTDLRFADVLLERCDRLRLQPARVILELTETTAMQNAAVTFDILTRVRLKGFQLSIDDFGTGYSSLVKLAQLPFSEIKIDKSFVDAMLSSPEARKIIATTIGLGKALHLTVVAEGVESGEQARQLAKLGCDQAQGYFFARPMDGATARTWLCDHAKVA